jgi:methylglutaconyl-CoA hydratase
VENGIGRILLNRPEKRNALNQELISELHQAIRESATDPAVRVVLLSGAGSDFCSGADLAGLQRAFDAGVLDQMADARKLAQLFQDMRHHPRPIIAAVRGRALAGGCGLATACDLIVAAESAQFGYPEVNIGFVPAIVMAILRRSVPEKRAFELITMGEIYRATDFGLVNQVFADETFDIDVDAYAGRMAAKSGSALQLCKSLLYQMDGMGFDNALEAGVQINAIARMTDDCKRGIEKFLRR